MAVKNLRQRIVAFIAGVLLGPAIVWAGLETGTYISDLVATNPLSSDLASTADDHIRLIKSTLKATFPNVNGAMSATDEELSLLAGKTGTVWTSANDGAASTLDADLLDGVSSAGFCQTGGSGCPGGVTGAANPSASVGLSAVNGSATTFMRSDGAPALSQSIAPSWSGIHTYTRAFSSVTDIAQIFSSALPGYAFTQSTGALNNKNWLHYVFNEDLYWDIYNDAGSSNTTWMKVSRTGITADAIALAATAVTINTVPITPASGTFTIDASGSFSGTVSGTARYEMQGNQVTLYVPTLNGTSDTTDFGLSGVPAAIRPTRAQSLSLPLCWDNGADTNLSWFQVNTDGTATVTKSGGNFSATTWTGSGTKGCQTFTITYITT